MRVGWPRRQSQGGDPLRLEATAQVLARRVCPHAHRILRPLQRRARLLLVHHIAAGAFGSYINVANAAAIGMLPALPLERFKQVGIAAGAGARRLLLSTRVRAEARALGSRVRFVELAQYPAFSRVFARNCRLSPH